MSSIKNRKENNTEVKFDFQLERISKILGILAILVGCFWFFSTRENYSRADLKQSVSDTEVNGKVLLHIFVTVKNTGKIPLSLGYENTRVYSVLPMGKGVSITTKPGSGERVDWNPADMVANRCVVWLIKWTFWGSVERSFTDMFARAEQLVDPKNIPESDAHCDCVEERDNKKQLTPMWLESGESDFVEWNLFIDKGIKKVRIYSYVEDEAEEVVGWQNVVFYDVTKHETFSP